MLHSSVCTGTLLQVKNGVLVLVNFSKTADRNETTPKSKQSLAQAGSNKKVSIHSTTSYSKVNVRYQMTKKLEYSGCRAKIRHLHLLKWYKKYIWEHSPYSDEARELKLIT